MLGYGTSARVCVLGGAELKGTHLISELCWNISADTNNSKEDPSISRIGIFEPANHGEADDVEDSIENHHRTSDSEFITEPSNGHHPYECNRIWWKCVEVRLASRVA